MRPLGYYQNGSNRLISSTNDRHLSVVPDFDSDKQRADCKIISTPELEICDYARIEMRQVSYTNKQGKEIKYLSYYGAECTSYDQDGSPTGYRLHRLKAIDVKSHYQSYDFDRLNSPNVYTEFDRVSLDVPQEIKISGFLIDLALNHSEKPSNWLALSSNGSLSSKVVPSEGGAPNSQSHNVVNQQVPNAPPTNVITTVIPPVGTPNWNNQGFWSRIKARFGTGGSGGNNGGGGPIIPNGGESWWCRPRKNRYLLAAALLTSMAVIAHNCEGDNIDGSFGKLDLAIPVTTTPTETSTTILTEAPLTTNTEAPTTTTSFTTTTAEVHVGTATTEVPTTIKDSPTTTTTEEPASTVEVTTTTIELVEPELAYMEPNVIGYKPCGPNVSADEVALRMLNGETIVKPGETAEFLNENPQVELGLNRFYELSSSGNTAWIDYIRKNVSITNDDVLDGGIDSGVRALKARTVAYALGNDMRLQNHQCDPKTGEITRHDGPNNRYNNLKENDQVWVIELTPEQLADMQASGASIPENIVIIDVDDETKAIVLERLACNNPLLELVNS